jgi:ABC-type polysaccharide/polyol phosphate transport system ATPase subunit
MARVSLQNISVELAVYNARGRAIKSEILRRTVGGRLEDSRDKSVVIVQALRNVTFEVHDGERVGLIGGNGAGKTTLLRVLSRVFTPTHGNALIEGRISSLIDLTMGMDPEATGYENIVMRGVMLGLDPKSAAELTDEVAEFSQLGEFLNLPIRTYSSGMMLRLAFAVTTAVQPEIAIFDELIGVGDAAFAERAQKRLERLISNANIMFLATHDNGSIRRFCNRVLWLSEGQVQMDGAPDDVINAYSAFVAGQAN